MKNETAYTPNFQSEGTIPLQTVLELISEDILMNGNHWAFAPSLAERAELVAQLKRSASFWSDTLYFDSSREPPAELPFYNYLLLQRTWTCRRGIEQDIYVWTLHGFHSFAALERYIVCEDSINRLFVFVKEHKHYRKADYRFFFQDEFGKKTYTDIAGFMNTFDDLLGKSGKWPYYHYHFEIRGLCELEFDGKLYCSILGSLDDLDVELEILTINYWDRVYNLLQNKDEGIAKTGFASFDGKSYIFTIRVNSSEASWELYDENLRAYSLKFHSFSKQWPTMKGVEIVAAP